MAEGIAGVEPEKPIEPRTDERYGMLADLTLDNLIERGKARTLTAAEMTVAFNLLKQAGVKLIKGAGSKSDTLARVLPNLPPIDAADRFTRTG